MTLKETLEGKTVAELQVICKQSGIKGYSGKKKREIIELIIANKGQLTESSETVKETEVSKRQRNSSFSIQDAQKQRKELFKADTRLIVQQMEKSIRGRLKHNKTMTPSGKRVYEVILELLNPKLSDDRRVELNEELVFLQKQLEKEKAKGEAPREVTEMIDLLLQSYGSLGKK